MLFLKRTISVGWLMAILMKKLFRYSLCTGLVAGCLFFAGVQFSYAQPVSVGGVTREIEKTLPAIDGRARRELKAAPAPRPGEAGKKRYIQDTTELPEEETLASPIGEIILSTPVLKKEIGDIVREKLYRRTKIGRKDLASARQQIWDVGIRNKRLLHVDFKVVPNQKELGQSWLIVTVVEIAVRHISVVSEQAMRPSLLESVQREAAHDFYEEKTLDLNDLDNKIKNRLRLGDVVLRTSVVPVDETHVDLKILVSPIPAGVPSTLVQVDNAGGWSYGRDRLIGGLSLPVGFDGDDLSLIAMKTADVGNGDFGNGVYYGRAEYTVPFGEWGVRLDTWASALRYHEVRAISPNTNSNGEAYELGQGVEKPVFSSASTTLDARADFTIRYTVDRALETVRISEKNEWVGRLNAALSHALWDRQMIHLTLTASAGTIDLSADKQAYLIDQAGPKVNGIFSKLEGTGTWSGSLGEDGRTDFRLAMSGQWTPNNLDSLEQFSLGGSTGLRAFGSGEAAGDIGFLVNGDVGYALESGFRPFAFYDVGAIWKSAHPWAGEGGPLDYLLQDVGCGISKTFDGLNMSVVFAHQLGPNPGLTAQGFDVDNTKQRYRVWASMSYRY